MVLTKERAEARGEVVERGSISYNFNICFEKGDNYSGYAELGFSLKRVPEQLPVDFCGKTVSRAVVNGEVSEIRSDGDFLYL